jgi:predicted RNA binding protein YcfA (HicA-like mRNA interferase family)
LRERTGTGWPRCISLTGHDVLRAPRGSPRHSNKPELRVVVAIPRRDLPPGTIRSIIKQSDLDEEQFPEWA